MAIIKSNTARGACITRKGDTELYHVAATNNNAKITGVTIAGKVKRFCANKKPILI